MTKKQLIETCMKLRPTAREWRAAVERHVNFFEWYKDFDFQNWEKGKYIEARGVVAGIMDKSARYHLYVHTDKSVQRKVRKIAKLMHVIM